jgi:curli production assembly/transport component CsgF
MYRFGSYLAALAMCAAVSMTGARAADLVYTPINPTFGGNPANSSHLLSIASAQKTATASDAPVTASGSSSGSGSGSGTGTSNAELFVSQLEGRLLSALASQVTDAIFGPNPQDHGTVTFGDTTVVFDNTGTAITLTITDPTGVTVISVPQLVVSP